MRRDTTITSRRSRRGGVILGVLLFILVTSVLLMGVGTYVVGHQTRVKVDSDYARALDLAEAGVNYEYRKLSNLYTDADQYPGATYSLGGGTFTVYCAEQDGTTPWDPGNYLYVISTGTINGVSRTVKVSSRAYYTMGDFAIFSMNGTSLFKGSSMSIVGDIGTNAILDFNSQPTVSGDIWLYGPDADLIGNKSAGFDKVTQPNPLVWPTVAEIAEDTVSGGLATLAVTNDNAKAIPPIVGNSITNSVVLPPGNYYVTNINLTGGKQITFANATGPVNIWVGPEGGSGTCKFRGGTAAVSISADSDKACHIYVATTSGIDLAGNARIDALIYAYNEYDDGTAYGRVEVSGNPTIYGQVFGNEVMINGNVTITHVTDLVTPVGGGYYGYYDSWQELNRR